MKKFYLCPAWLVLFLLLAGCSGSQMQQPDGGPPPAMSAAVPAPAPMPDASISMTILQMNDVYEIQPVEGGARGGLARVATLRKQLLADDPHTLTLIAGDFFSPSALGTARVDNVPLAGQQMVAVLNTLGLDYATFGNHEFDVKRDQFYQRLEESAFTYVSSNVFDENGQPFPGTVDHAVIEVPGAHGGTLRVGLLGLTLNSNPQDYVSYTDPMAAAKAQVAALEGQVDVMVALTHLALDQDMRLAAEVPEIDLILGGHEHENVQVLRGPKLTPIVKADANARTVYVHKLTFNPADGSHAIMSDIHHVTSALADDPETAAVVDKWVGIAFEGFRQQGLKPGEPMAMLTEPMDGRESSVRNHPTTLTDLIAASFLEVVPGAELAIFNSGSVRIDDVLPPGQLIQYDVIRVLPFGGDILSVEMRGSVLDSILTQGVANKGSGGYLVHAGVTHDGGWRVGSEPIDPARTYRVAISDFLMTGNEANLGYLTFQHPGITKTGTHGDIRFAVIAELQRRYGTP